VSQRETPRVNASVSQSVLTGSPTIITRVFAYGKSQASVPLGTPRRQDV